MNLITITIWLLEWVSLSVSVKCSLQTIVFTMQMSMLQQ